jgi:hypothetical protein
MIDAIDSNQQGFKGHEQESENNGYNYKYIPGSNTNCRADAAETTRR